MTVNYTTNLSLGQPVTGTESGTWGDDVNNAVTSYLDIAISGSLALTSASFTANALTIANTQGTSSATNIGATTAQYYVLRVSSLAANVTITAPSVSKTYLVVNSDATYSVTVKASGQTGISVAAGERAIVYYNGTDYIKVTSSVVSNLTGTLPVANGGTGLTSTPANGALDIGNGTGFTRTTLSAGTGISITNTSGAITVTNTSPSSGGTVTSVTGTAPVVSSGGATPAISMAAASTSVSGYLTSTDWNTFNGKQAAGSYVTVGGALGTPSSGTLTNCTFPTLNQNTTGSSGSCTGNAATATNPQAGGTFITSSNIGSQSVNFASSATNATNATNATTATNATNATNATTATNATRITNSGGWSVTPSGTKLYFNYNGTNVGSLDSSGNFIVTGNVTAYGTA